MIVDLDSNSPQEMPTWYLTDDVTVSPNSDNYYQHVELNAFPDDVACNINYTISLPELTQKCQFLWPCDHELELLKPFRGMDVDERQINRARDFVPEITLFNLMIGAIIGVVSCLVLSVFITIAKLVIKKVGSNLSNF